MSRLKIILGIAIFAVIVSAGWQIGSSELANVELQDDMRDMASQVGAHFGFAPPSSDEELVRKVIRKAQEHDIELTPEQVTVNRTGTNEYTTLYLALTTRYM
ncbi:MAG: hypothetical protein NVS1B11_22680 [Terriglobales bacterium]